VKLANGEIIQGIRIFSLCKWKCQGAIFTIDLQVLPQDSYNDIIGMEWFRNHSTMEVDWEQKWMIFLVGAGKHKLQGVVADISVCAQISQGNLNLEEQRGQLHFFLLKPVHKEILE
jgi:hypothetical protein